jgi:pilus assembly protein FimV
MKWKLRIACAALLAAPALPAFALQLGEIQVKSALNQPLVASIPLHPKNLTELDGLTVGLAAATDFQRAGLPLTPTDQTLRFHVVTDNNGQKLVLVTSSQPITDPYLDFLVQVNTREGRQVREFVVLLNPVIAAPAPAVQAAPVASAPAAATPAAQPAELPPPTQFPQPQVKREPAPQPQIKPQPAPQPQVKREPAPQPQVKPQPAAPQPATPPPQSAAPAGSHPQTGEPINVQRGDTLYHLAQQAIQGTDVNVNQMMLAMQAANPNAFFNDNIDNLKAGAILRIPTRDQIDRHSVATAAAEVRRQYAAWRTVKPHPATVVEGAAAQAAANAAPQAGSAPATSDHLTLAPPTGQAGGTSNRPGVAGGTGHATVAGLKQQLQADRDALISLNQSNTDLGSRIQSLENIQTKTSQLLQLKDATIAELQRKLAAVQTGHAGTAGAVQAKSAASAATHAPATQPARAATPWYMRPLVWGAAALVVLALLVLGLFGGRRRAVPDGAAQGPLDGPVDVLPPVDEAAAPEPPAASALMADVEADTSLESAALPPAAAGDDPYGLSAMRRSVTEDDAAVLAPVALARADDGIAAGPLNSNDPIDTKLDLARAYLDMGDPVGARAMLEEVIEEGTQVQKDEAKRLLAEATG